MNQDTIGIDISKAHLDAHRLRTGEHARFDNTAAGIGALRRWIGPAPERVVYEPTGPYHRCLEAAFCGRLPLVKVNPLQARRFAQAQGQRAKTDAVDAKMLARMGAAFGLVPGRPVTENQLILNELQVARAALVRDRVGLINRLGSQTLGLTRRQTRARIAQAERQIAALEAEIDTRLNARSETARMQRILTSIPGVGAVTARTILITCPEVGRLPGKQIAALAGLAPMARQSGKWRGKTPIQGGRKPLRDAPFMPALVAMKRNPDLARTYDRLRADGKPHKVALVALTRKLIELANTLVRQDRLWQPKCP